MLSLHATLDQSPDQARRLSIGCEPDRNGMWWSWCRVSKLGLLRPFHVEQTTSSSRLDREHLPTLICLSIEPSIKLRFPHPCAHVAVSLQHLPHQQQFHTVHTVHGVPTSNHASRHPQVHRRQDRGVDQQARWQEHPRRRSRVYGNCRSTLTGPAR